MEHTPPFSDQDVLALRGPKHKLDAFRPYNLLHEAEPQPDGTTTAVNTIFLTNKECPFKCVMCDLWKHTLDGRTPPGAIVAQIRYALEQLPPAPIIKLYNNGNFFDPAAIPPAEYRAIAALLQEAGAGRVIVENHPKIGRRLIPRFQQALGAEIRLEIALGIESVHPEVLPKLNKKTSVQEIADTAAFLQKHDIALRGFILLNPPFVQPPTPDNYIYWCLKSIDFAFSHGFETVSIIPVRGGNGMMEQLKAGRQFYDHENATLPLPEMLLEVAEEAGRQKRGRIFVDTWDIERFFDSSVSPENQQRLRTRLNAINASGCL
ncbi:MAG: radical SAM protein [Cyclonatronaceae bacterium]